MKKGWKIFIIVLVVVIILVFLYFIIFRRAICSNPIMIERPIDPKLKEQLRDISGSDKTGVFCQGEEGGDVVRLGTGGRRSIVCNIKTNETAQYELKVKEINILLGNEKTKLINTNWILQKGWKGTVNSSKEGYEIKLLTLNIPKDAPKSTIELDYEVIKNNDLTTNETHIVMFDIFQSPSLWQRITNPCY